MKKKQGTEKSDINVLTKYSRPCATGYWLKSYSIPFTWKLRSVKTCTAITAKGSTNRIMAMERDVSCDTPPVR